MFSNRFVIVFSLVVAVLLVALLWTLHPTYTEVCEKAQNAQGENCATYHMALGFWLHVGKFLDDHNGAIIAIFTVVLAISTFALWRSTDKLWAAGERQYRLTRAMALNQQAQTRESNEIAREAAERQLRAYVVVKNINLQNVAAGQSPKAIVVYENTGQTPAYDVAVVAEIGLTPLPAARVPPVIARGEQSKGLLGARVQNKSEPRLEGILSQEQIDRMRNETDTLHVLGTITYEDAFGHKRFTHFNALYGHRYMGETGPAANASEGNTGN